MRPDQELLEQHVGTEPTVVPMTVILDLPPNVTVTSLLPKVPVTVTPKG